MTSYNAFNLNRRNGFAGVRFDIDEATGEPSIFPDVEGYADENDSCYPTLFEVEMIEIWCRHARAYLESKPKEGWEQVHAIEKIWKDMDDDLRQQTYSRLMSVLEKEESQ